MDPELTQGLIEEIVPKIDEMSEQGLTPCLVTTADLQACFAEIFRAELPATSHLGLPGNSI